MSSLPQQIPVISAEEAIASQSGAGLECNTGNMYINYNLKLAINI